MIPADILGRVSSWVVRRGGLSRCVWIFAAAGLGVAGALRPGVAVALASAAVCVAGLVGVTGLGRGRSACSGVAAGLPPLLLIAAAGAVGLLWGSVRVDARLGGELALTAGATVDLRAEVVSPPRGRADGVRFFARSLGPLGAGEGLLLDLSGAPEIKGAPFLEEGMLIRVDGRLRAPESPAAGADSSVFDERAWLEREGVAVVLEGDLAQVAIEGRRKGLAGLLDRTRRAARARLASGLDPTTGSLLRGIILGDKADIPDATLDDFRRAGIAHILAVSGLHVGALAAGVALAFRLLRLGPMVRTVGAVALVVFFALLTGAGPSVTRASVMAVTVLMALLLGRGRDNWGALALAAVVVLAMDPLAVTSPGFQLSFSAVAALLALARPLEARLSRRLPTSLAAGAAVSLAAGLGTAPVSLLTFGQVSLVGVIANLLVVPVVPLIMALGFASIAVGAVFAPLSPVLNGAAGVLIGWVSSVGRALGAAPVMTPRNAAPILLGVLGGWVGWKSGQRRRMSAERVGATPGPEGLTHLRRARVGAAVVGVALFAGVPAVASSSYSWGVSAWGARAWPARGEVRVMDVGEGGAALVRSPSGVSILIDAGPEGSDLSGDLRHLGVDGLDAVVVSHPHADHFGGLRRVVEELGVGLIVDNVEEARPPPARGGDRGTRASGGDVSGDGGGQGEAYAYLDVRSDMIRRGARHVIARDGARLVLGDVALEFEAPEETLCPTPRGEWSRSGSSAGGRSPMSSESLNAASLVVIVRVGGLAILVPGDAEAATLTSYALPGVDCLVVPHHGSGGAVSASLLGRLSPATAVVSVGEGNSFGHPDAGTMDALADAGVQVFRTDLSGWVAVRPPEDGGPGLTIAVETGVNQ